MRLSGLFQRRQATPAAGEAARQDGLEAVVPRGLRVYAIGDIHGRHDLVLELESLIAADLAGSRPPAEVWLVYLGDYVDRGPQSRQVIQHLLAPSGLRARRLCLRGNHDAWFQEALAGALDPAWIDNGGIATLASYGIAVERGGALPTAARLASRVPPAHAGFLERLAGYAVIGDYIFCHAGIRPGVALAEQSPDDLMWIREPFLSFSGSLGGVVVHGHTVTRQVEFRSNRIGIDTGAVWTGQLTALALEGDARRLLQTGHGDAG